jgi:hypothetical protein
MSREEKSPAEDSGLLFFLSVNRIADWRGVLGHYLPFVLLELEGEGLDMRVCWCF